jgi:hypothetical protein
MHRARPRGTQGSAAVHGALRAVRVHKVNQRPFELAGWHGFAQQLAHTFPPGMDDPTYDDLVTVVVQKANVILYVGFEQTKQTGERADSSSRVRAAMKVALNRLG